MSEPKQHEHDHSEYFHWPFGQRPSYLFFDGGRDERGKTRNSEKRYIPEEFIPVVDEKNYGKKCDEKVSEKKQATLLARVSEGRSEQNDRNDRAESL